VTASISVCDAPAAIQRRRRQPQQRADDRRILDRQTREAIRLQVEETGAGAFTLDEKLGERRRVGDRLPRRALLEVGAERLVGGLERRQLGSLGQHPVEFVESMEVVGMDE
jgi:hypothetical protein